MCKDKSIFNFKRVKNLICRVQIYESIKMSSTENAIDYFNIGVLRVTKSLNIFF